MVVLLSLPSLAATLTVPGDHATLQDAVDAASDGDRIEVDAGTWGSVEVQTDVTIVGVGPDTILSASDTVVTTYSSDVVLEAVSVTGGTRGLHIVGGSFVLRDATVSGITGGSEHGAGMYGNQSTIELDGVTFSDNTLTGYNGAHLFTNDADLTVVDSTFSGGSAQRGGAALLYDSTSIFRDTTFSGNVAVETDETPRGGALRIEAGEATFERCSFADNTADGGYGGHISTLAADVSIVDSDFERGLADGRYGGAIASYESNTEVSGSTFTDNSATFESDSYGYGGAIIALGDAGGYLGISGSTFTGNSAAERGGAIRIVTGTADIDSSAFETNSATTRGGALDIGTGETVTIRSSTFLANQAEYGAGLEWRQDTPGNQLLVETSRFEDNDAGAYGAGIYANTVGDLVVQDSAFEGNIAAVGAGVFAWTADTVTGIRNRFCDNAAVGDTSSDGAAVFVYQSGASGNAWTNNLFVENFAEGVGGGLAVVDSDAADVINNHFLANTATTGAAAAFRNTTGPRLVNDLVAWQDGPAVYADSDTTLEIAYNDFWDNADGDVDGSLSDPDDTNLAVDPLLVDFTADGDCSNDKPWPDDDSPLIDAGDPSIEDADETRSDIGALGGPDGDPDSLIDDDGDGYTRNVDCDDADPDVSPGAEEVPYDGIDNDCSGGDLTDVDADGFDGGDEGSDCDDTDDDVYPGAADTWYDAVDSDCAGNDDYDADADGYASDEYGGDDCDDTDADIHPGADDPAGDGIDADCDGLDTEEVDDGEDTGDDKNDSSTRGCGCSSTSAGGAAWSLLLLLPLLRRR